MILSRLNFYNIILFAPLVSLLAFSQVAQAEATHQQLQAQIIRLETIGFLIMIALLACILFVLVYVERAIKKLARLSLAGNIRNMPIDMRGESVQNESVMNPKAFDETIFDENILRSEQRKTPEAQHAEKIQLALGNDETQQNYSTQDESGQDDAPKMQDIQFEGVLAMDGATDASGGNATDDISNLPGIVAQCAFPESLEALRQVKPSGTSEHDLWRWVQDVLLHLPKYGLKNDSTMMLPENQEDYQLHHRLEQGLRYFNMNQFSDALQEFFQVTLRSENMVQQLSADFMKMQILFRLELWVDANEIANKIIGKYHKMKPSDLVSVAFATAYMVRGAHRMQFLDDEDGARGDMDKAISYTVNMDNHDMLMASVMMHAHLFKVALYARSNPATSLKAMQTILRLFTETVIPEIQTVRDTIKEFF
ncbi:MAG: hypothetical protein K0U45_09465 [Alphaproteobacteria bacterium]|nr:hypothetical protein [Alphaproteobacteria bacterium]